MLVVIPAHNEVESLAETVAELRRVRPDLDVLVIDDGSDDGSAALVPSLGVPWLRFPMCLGIGTAMRAALRYATLHGHDTVVRIDADGQHAPEDLAGLLGAVTAVGRDAADAAVGSRYLEGAGAGFRASGGRRVVQRVLGRCLGWVVRRRVTDPTSGFWAFGPAAVRLLGEHHPTGYAEPELHLLLWRQGLKVVEVPVSMRARGAGRSTLTWSRALTAVARAFLALVVAPLRNTRLGDAGKARRSL